MIIYSLTSDGLPIAYTVEELYDRVVELKTQMKSDKQQLIELQTLFSYVRKMMDSVAETSFLGETYLKADVFDYILLLSSRGGVCVSASLVTPE